MTKQCECFDCNAGAYAPQAGEALTALEVRPCVDANGNRTSWDICYPSEPDASGVGVVASCYGTREQADTMVAALSTPTPQAGDALARELEDAFLEQDRRDRLTTLKASDNDALREACLIIGGFLDLGLQDSLVRRARVWLNENPELECAALSTAPTMSAEDMREAAAKVAAEHKPKRVQQGKTLKGYDPEDLEIIRSEESGEYIAASIIATAIRSLPLTKEKSQ